MISGIASTLIGIAVVAYIAWRLSFNQKEQLPPQSFVVSGRPDLIIDNPFGAIRVHCRPVNTIEIRATRYYSSFFSRRPSYPLDTSQEGNQIKLHVWNPRVRGAFSPGDLGRIELDIIAPESSDVHIRSDASSVTIDGIHGAVNINTNAGTIDIKNASLTGQTSAHTNAGTISFQNVRMEESGQLHTNLGSINIRPM